ncbi:hypothetical protein BGZ83_004372 [Gryganskiella cystojenkinii]|nr:hypothetical protein BGZ83_004372 [Gryganskiella cystojenkinii]
MLLSHEHRTEHQQKLQQQQYQFSQPQYPYNPYQHQKYSQTPQYTLRSDDTLSVPEFTPKSTPTTTTATAAAAEPSPMSTSSNNSTSTAAPVSVSTLTTSSGNSGTAPSQDMFFELEQLLMGITPFPPTIPAIAKPTCPSLDDQVMTEMSSPSSSPSSTTSSIPSVILNEQSMDVLQDYYQRSHRAGDSHHYQHNHHHQLSTHDNCSSGSMTPPRSPYSYASSASPTLALENSVTTDLPYWSPSTPSMQMEHQWSGTGSNHSSPLIQQQPPQSQQPSQQPAATTWGYSLFETSSSTPSTSPLNNMSDLGRYISHTDSQYNQSAQQKQQQQSTYSYYSSPVPTTMTMASALAAKRAARTHQRNLSLPGGVRPYESNAREHHSYMYYSQQPQRSHQRSMTAGSTSCSNGASGQQSSSTRSNNNSNNNNNGQTNSRSAATSGTSSSNRNSSCSSSSSSSSNGNNNNNNNNNSRVKSYPCPTCTKPFPTRTQLKSHMAIHVDHFPFPCLYSGCDLHFKRKHDLRRHVDAKHALIKKYLCSGGCGEGFGRRDQMMRHLRRGTCGHSFSQVQTTTTTTASSM